MSDLNLTKGLEGKLALPFMAATTMASSISANFLSFAFMVKVEYIYVGGMINTESEFLGLQLLLPLTLRIERVTFLQLR